MQVDLESGLIVALHHHRAFGIHDRRTSETALNGLENQFWVNTGLLGQGKGLGNSLNVTGHNNLVCQLGGVSCADFAATDDGSAHRL